MPWNKWWTQNTWLVLQTSHRRPELYRGNISSRYNIRGAPMCQVQWQYNKKAWSGSLPHCSLPERNPWQRISYYTHQLIQHWTAMLMQIFTGAWTHENSMQPASVKSRSRYVITFCKCPILWTSKLQSKIALSTIKSLIYMIITGASWTDTNESYTSRN